MIGKLKQSISNAGELLREQANALGEAAKQKGYSIIDDWVSILPKMKSYGLETTFFSVSVSLNPTLDIELTGDAKKFTKEYLEQLIEETKTSTPMNLVFNSMKTTFQFYSRTNLELRNPLTVRIKVRLSPEVRVSYGTQVTE